MSGKIVPTKVIRNGFIALVSTAWIVPLGGSAFAVFSFLHAQNSGLLSELGDSRHLFTYIATGRGLLGLATYWLMGITAFWACVAANRLWPVREADDSERLEEE